MEKDKLIYQKEIAFNGAFDRAICQITRLAHEGSPITLRKVLSFGFNNVFLNGKKGFEEDDFNSDELDTLVDYNDWGYDLDGYRIVYLETYRKSVL